MRNWGIVITCFYAAVVILLFTFGVEFLYVVDTEGALASNDFGHFDFTADFWIWILIIVAAQLLLLFLSVDSSWRRMRPRQHVKVTASLVGFLVVILFISVVVVIAMAYSGDESSLFDNGLFVFGATLILLWAFWGVLFYFYSKRTIDVVDLAVSWLIKGSVLELLVAVPCHIIVRQRDECSAPFLTAYGIATGIAIMLLAFGPSVLFLYQRKLGDYRGQSKAPK